MKVREREKEKSSSFNHHKYWNCASKFKHRKFFKCPFISIPNYIQATHFRLYYYIGLPIVIEIVNGKIVNEKGTQRSTSEKKNGYSILKKTRFTLMFQLLINWKFTRIFSPNDKYILLLSIIIFNDIIRMLRASLYFAGFNRKKPTVECSRF